MVKTKCFVVILAATILGVLSSYGQIPAQPTPAPAPTPQTANDARGQFNSDTSGDDILILANITAKELRFDAVPNTKVEFPGRQKRTNIWVTQRQNLPDEVQAGVTYHDVGLQLRISTRFAEIEQIVRQAISDQAADDAKKSPPSSDAPGTTKPPPPQRAGVVPKEPSKEN